MVYFKKKVRQKHKDVSVSQFICYCLKKIPQIVIHSPDSQEEFFSNLSFKNYHLESDMHLANNIITFAL